MFKLRMTHENSGSNYRVYIFSQKDYEIIQQEYHLVKEKYILGQIWVTTFTLKIYGGI